MANGLVPSMEITVTMWFKDLTPIHHGIIEAVASNRH